MQYSFIKPRAKHIISPEFKLLFFFFGITMALLLVTYTFLKTKTFLFDEAIQAQMLKAADLKHGIIIMHDNIAQIKIQNRHSEGVYTENTVLKESIHNLFDLVPEKITLSQALLKENELVLYGVTPSKEVYEFLLQAPLRSIFHRSYTSYYAMPNGWYSFVSKNYLDRPLP